MGMTVQDALFTTTQQRVLRIFFGQPYRSYIQQELIDVTGSGSGAVQRELARLLESGLVTMTILGRQKHYQANRDAPVFEELRAIVEKTMGARRARVVRERRARVEAEVPREEVPSPESEWQVIFD